MRHQLISRIFTALLLGVLFGTAVHLDHVRRGHTGREEFLAAQASRFDKFYANPPWAVFEILGALVFTGVTLGVYELIVMGISSAMRKAEPSDRVRSKT